MPHAFRLQLGLLGVVATLASACGEGAGPAAAAAAGSGGQVSVGAGPVDVAGATNGGISPGGAATTAGAGGLPDTAVAGGGATAGGATMGGSGGAGGAGGASTPSLIPDPTQGGWQLNEYSMIVDGALELTPGREDTDGHERGSAFWPTALASEGLHIEFDSDITPKKNQGDGMTLALADTSAGAKPTDFGDSGGGLGYASAPCCLGIKGLAVALDTSKNANDPGPNFLGVATGGVIDKITWAATQVDGIPAWVGAVHHLAVTISGGTLTIAVDGADVLHTTAGTPTIPAQVLVGFTGANGSGKSRQLVRNLVVSRP